MRYKSNFTHGCCHDFRPEPIFEPPCPPTLCNNENLLFFVAGYLLARNCR
ncbi:MAG: hypothetical protein IJ817_03560 [Clostridia bacterium]|nr:hypothetical protein [Clostridia bacterium]